jgi:hypothetical protein
MGFNWFNMVKNNRKRLPSLGPAGFGIGLAMDAT